MNQNQSKMLIATQAWKTLGGNKRLYTWVEKIYQGQRKTMQAWQREFKKKKIL